MVEGRGIGEDTVDKESAFADQVASPLFSRRGREHVRGDAQEEREKNINILPCRCEAAMQDGAAQGRRLRGGPPTRRPP